LSKTEDLVILLAKQLDTGHSDSMENVDSEMQSHAYQNEVCHLAAATSLA
jgi:hypothetical protein